jgi:hypothetical protein
LYQSWDSFEPIPQGDASPQHGMSVPRALSRWNSFSYNRCGRDDAPPQYPGTGHRNELVAYKLG